MKLESQIRAALLDSQRNVLERIAIGAPLAEILDSLVGLIEEQAEGMRCAVLLADPGERRLRFVAAPNIPEDYKTGIEPFLRIAPNMGSCGTAAFLRAPVYTCDTATDILWRDCAEIAVRNGLRAIWSTPILADDGVVLGTFAMYYGEPRLPLPEHIQLIDMATQIARVAIQRKQDDERLRASEEKFRQMAENIREVFWMTTPAMDELLYVSPAYESIWGRTVESLRQRPKSFIDAIHEEDRERVVGIIEGRREQEFEVEYRIARPDGTMRWVRDRGFPVKDESGKVYRIAGVAEDITERKRAEEASLQIASKIRALSEQKEASLRLVIDTIPTMAWSLLPDGTVDFVNRRWMDYTGLSLEEALEDSTRIVHPDDLPRALAQWRPDMAAGKPGEDEMRLRRADGEYRWFLIRTVPLRDEQGNIVKWYGTSTDIEDGKRAADMSRESTSRLQALSRRLVELQESERKEIARELHDRVGQNLTAISINFAILQEALAHHDAGVRARIEDSVALVSSTLHAIEDVLSDLRPPMLDNHGLRSSLDWYAKQFSARSGIAVSLRAAEQDERMAPDAEIALFRIAQEALNNVAKHAHANSVVIALESRPSDYVMSVTDDGVGLRAADTVRARRPGLGLVTMKERAQAVGGSFRIESLPSGGTQLTVRIPK